MISKSAGVPVPAAATAAAGTGTGTASTDPARTLPDRDGPSSRGGSTGRNGKASQADQGGRRPRTRRSTAWRVAGFVVPVWIYILCFYVYPLIANVRMGFQDYSVSSFYSGSAPYVGFANYRSVFHSPQFAGIVTNTLLFTLGSLVFQFGIGLALAVFFRRKFPLNGVLRSLLLVPWLLPLVVSGTVWRWMMYADSGVLNRMLLNLHVINHPVPWLVSTTWSLTAVTLVNVWVGIPFNMVILYGGLQGVPEQLYEAAAIDGANAWQRFRRITWPMLRPVTLVVLTLGLIYTVKVFDVIQIVTQGGPANSSQTLTTYAYNLSFQQLEFGKGAAVGNLLILVAIVFAALYLRSVRETEGRNR
ncbi:carbohydrate ABC transporter permease [Catenulispora rubra]|uniref:carbohydrate ABC transporter permease n=1 Tax=Catenulispora rubra TaxID=280293 RepID=UPI001E4EA63A|nr:sugar ABC transporter permease [Catenulispora rubra]